MMNNSRLNFARNGISTLVKVVLILVVLFAAAAPAFALNSNPGVIPPGAKPYGKTINEWTVDWWKYVMGFPASTNPLADASGKDCAVGQSGNVFFLVGTTGGPAVRNECVVPTGKAILFPIINVISAVPEDAATSDDLTALVTWYMGHTDQAEVTLDGVALNDLLEDYRFPSPIFSFDGAAPGIFAPMYEGHRDIAFSDGWWVMLPPLPAGAHTIHFLGHLYVPDWDYGFTTEVTYNLVVK